MTSRALVIPIFAFLRSFCTFHDGLLWGSKYACRMSIIFYHLIWHDTFSNCLSNWWSRKSEVVCMKWWAKAHTFSCKMAQANSNDSVHERSCRCFEWGSPSTWPPGHLVLVHWTLGCTQGSSAWPCASLGLQRLWKEFKGALFCRCLESWTIQGKNETLGIAKPILLSWKNSSFQMRHIISLRFTNPSHAESGSKSRSQQLLRRAKVSKLWQTRHVQTFYTGFYTLPAHSPWAPQ